MTHSAGIEKRDDPLVGKDILNLGGIAGIDPALTVDALTDSNRSGGPTKSRSRVKRTGADRYEGNDGENQSSTHR
jgi:hypothetical protein